MRTVIQRVSSASVTINKIITKTIAQGLVVFIGVSANDTKKDSKWMADKILNLRIFYNDEGKFDKSLLDIKGEILIISQFTLYGDANKGRRPDFTKAAKPDISIPLYEGFVNQVKASGLKVETGEFGADMLVDIKNDGPVTIILDSPIKSL